MVRKWNISGDDESAVISYDQEQVHTTMFGLFNLGKLTVEQLQELEQKYPAQTSMTEESEMFHIQAGDIRKMFPKAGKGAVGFIPIEIADEEYMVLIAEPMTEEEAFELWWVHLYVE